MRPVTKQTSKHTGAGSCCSGKAAAVIAQCCSKSSKVVAGCHN